MLKLSLKTAQYEYLERGFKEWLDILGYCDSTVYNMPHIARELMHFLESRSVNAIQALTRKDLKAYHDYINRRANQRRGGGLSEKYIQMHIQGVEKFLEYLHHRGIKTLMGTGIRLTAPPRKAITVLTTDEIRLLFTATSKTATSGRIGSSYYEAMQARDRVMLTIYYSCGLRRTEGVYLSIDDINFDTRILHVKKGKNYKERFVPFGKSSSKTLQDYIYDHRPLLVKDKREGRLFISYGGRRMTGGTLNSRLQLLQRASEDIDLQQKEVHLHILRHSIATHLLEAGMSLEKIARFLGHSTMDSTQIYTHLIQKES